MAKLKVYGGGVGRGERAVVAATSQKEAVRLLKAGGANLSLHYFSEYWSITHNPEELRIALSEPGAVFAQPLLNGGPYAKWGRRP